MLSILVLGIGNLIMADDGIGVLVVQLLTKRYWFPPSVSILDGGTLGLDLLPKLEGVEKLLVLDAVATGKVPGDIVRLAGEDVPLAMETKLSPHQMGLKDLLSVAALQGHLPGEIVLLGIEPAHIGLGLDLSPAVAKELETLVDLALQELVRWGVVAVAKSSAEAHSG